ncbi:MAG: fumarate hydratase [Candidatus Hecatellales archaeon]|nr:MAG: fumarate hydratase [Candidatus Hecatellales archaeon]
MGKRNKPPSQKKTLGILLENIRIAKEKSMTICQDTGVPEFLIKMGLKFRFEGDFEKAIKDGIRNLTKTKNFPLVPLVVHPLTRENTLDNTGEKVPILHYSTIPNADYVELTATVAPAAPQTFSNIRMYPAGTPLNEIKNFVYETLANISGAVCPPLIVGIGIGGLFGNVTRLAREASLRPLNVRNPDPEIAKLEDELLKNINRLGIGHMALGGDTTVLAVNIEVGYTHIPCLPVAVQLQCWACRRATVRIYPDGRVEEVV